jgi:hypothetical protein
MIASETATATALLVPVGPSPEDVHRLRDLLDSVAHFEPHVRPWIVLDDAPGDRDLASVQADHPQADLVVLANPRDRTRAAARGRTPGLSAAVLRGLQWVRRNVGAAYVLKMDVDALAIGRFQEKLAALFRRHPQAGLVGCIGETCDRAHPRFERVLGMQSFFVTALQMSDAVTADTFGDGKNVVALTDVAGAVQATRDHYEAFQAVRPELSRAIANGLSSHCYCQGGAWALCPLMLERMEAAGYLERPGRWEALPFFGEDVTIAMYAYAVGMEVRDYSNTGEPFGLSYRGLPFTPEQLVEKGYSLIHSVKGDANFEEPDIRRFFAERRRTQVC